MKFRTHQYKHFVVKRRSFFVKYSPTWQNHGVDIRHNYRDDEAPDPPDVYCRDVFFQLTERGIVDRLTSPRAGYLTSFCVQGTAVGNTVHCRTFLHNLKESSQFVEGCGRISTWWVQFPYHEVNDNSGQPRGNKYDQKQEKTQNGDSYLSQDNPRVRIVRADLWSLYRHVPFRYPIMSDMFWKSSSNGNLGHVPKFIFYTMVHGKLKSEIYFIIKSY